VREGLFKRIEKIFEAFGWDVVTVKYGVLQRAAFEEPGGESCASGSTTAPTSFTRRSPSWAGPCGASG
jgi:pyruvate dehydrogenase complex dehydrogenase (E1) component